MHSAPMADELLGSQGLDLATALTLLPSLLIVFFTPTYVYHHSRLIITRRGNVGSWLKLGLASTLFCMEAQVCFLPQPIEAGLVQVFASCVYLGFLCVVLALYVEHQNIFKGPGLLAACFAVNLLFDASKAYAMLTLQGSIDSVLTALICQKVLIIVLESGLWRVDKASREGRHTRQEPPPKKKRGAFGIPILAVNLEDLPDLDEELQLEHLYLQFEEAWKAVNHDDPYCIWKATYLAFPHLMLGTLFSRSLLAVAIFSQPLLMRYMIQVAEMDQPTLNESASLLAMTALVYGGIVLSKSYSSYAISRLSISLKGAVSTHIVSKTMRLNCNSPECSTAISTLGGDTTTIDDHVNHVFALYGDVADSIAGVLLLVLLVGPVGLASIIPLAVLIVVNGRRSTTSNLLMSNRNAAERHQVDALTRFLPALKDLKITGLEPVLTSFIRNVQSDEIECRDAWIGHAVAGHILNGVCEKCIPVVTIASSMIYERFSEKLTATTIFPPLAVATLLVVPMLGFLETYMRLWSTISSIQAVQDFLLLQEHVDSREIGPIIPSTGTGNDNTAQPRIVSVSNMQENMDFLTGPFVCLFFSQLSMLSASEGRYIPDNISGHFLASQLNMIVGPVACGKSALLQALLGEAAVASGIVCLREHYSIAYCAQIPWLPNTTIRKCIVGVYAYDLLWYSKVVKACDLDYDFQRLLDGDQSMTGNNGSLLSGGQRQRVALARALYSQSDILLLDDTFSSLDRVTSRRIFTRLFGKDGLVKQAKITTIMSTHSVEFLPEADHILAFGEDGLLQSHDNFYDIDMNSITLAALRHSEDFAMDESNWQSLPTPGILEVQAATAEKPTEDPSISYPSDWAVERFFFSLIPRRVVMFHFLFSALTAIIEQFPGVYSRYLLESQPQETWYLSGNLIMLLIHPFIHFGMYKGYQGMIMESRAALAHKLRDTLSSANVATLMELEFGFVLARFLDDPTIVHTSATHVMRIWLFSTYNLLDFAVLVSASTIFLLSAPVIVACGIFLQRLYAKAYRSLKLLDVQSKTSVYTHIIEITAGLHHIRAFQWQERYKREVYQKLYSRQQIVYFQSAVQRWFKLSLELMVFAAAMLIATLAIRSAGTSSSPASIALGVFILLRVSHKLHCAAEAWIDFTTTMTAISPAYKLIETTPKELCSYPTDEQLPATWPAKGDLLLQNVNAGYRLNQMEESPVIKNITFRLQPGYRIGVVGRTGSGKTSIALAILNSLSFIGTVTIDGIDISTVPPQDLRRRITVITQNPTELPGSVRDNLVPFADDYPDGVDDNTILAVLNEVGLLEHVQDHGGIDILFTEMKFSQGQKQLLCLARAMLHNSTTKSRLVIIDEATSSMDYDTDSAMQQVMAEAFAGCTMVIIAHRVESLRGVDYLMELEAGEIVSLVPCSERASKAESKG